MVVTEMKQKSDSPPRSSGGQLTGLTPPSPCLPHPARSRWSAQRWARACVTAAVPSACALGFFSCLGDPWLQLLSLASSPTLLTPREACPPCPLRWPLTVTSSGLKPVLSAAALASSLQDGASVGTFFTVRVAGFDPKVRSLQTVPHVLTLPPDLATKALPKRSTGPGSSRVTPQGPVDGTGRIPHKARGVHNLALPDPSAWSRP